MHLPDALPPAARAARLDRLVAQLPISTDERPGIPVEAPFTGERLGAVPAATGDDVRRAVERARTAQAAWADRPVADRASVLLAFHDLILDRQDDVLDLLQAEAGKARRHGFEEVLDVAITARHYAHRAEGYLASDRRRGAIPGFTTAVEYHHPVGVVGGIAPWNYPLTLAVSDAIPALLAGNAVVLKPASQTPYTALQVAALLREAGLPEDVFQVVTGRGSEVGPALIDAVDHVDFTGSTETGRRIASRAAENLVPASLELGGKNPMLVLADADLDRAVAGAVRGAFTNAGQLCISIERLYVQRAVYEPFLDRLVRRTRALDLGAGFDHDTDVGSLVDGDQLATVEAHVEDAVERGATLLTGGRHRPDLGPYFYEPTVLADVTGEMRVGCEETFGPVVSVYPFDDVTDAVAMANDSRYGLNASVWTGDPERGRAVARRIEAGTVNVNDPYSAAWASVDAPMGGRKNSGMGRRHGRQGFMKYTESQTVATQRVLPLRPPDGVPAGWYARAMTAMLRAMKRVPGLR